MPLTIYVDAYCRYRANERPKQFCVDEDLYEIVEVERQWRSPDALFFCVRSTDGKKYILRYVAHLDEWTLESAYDGAELFARPSIEFVTVGPNAIREAERVIFGCQGCRPEESEIPFDWVLADVLNKRGPYKFVLTDTALCPELG